MRRIRRGPGGAPGARAGYLAIDLTARIPHGTGQTYLREILLAIDHAAYHMGELIVARRLLGAWPR